MLKRDDYEGFQDQIFQEIQHREDLENEPVRAAKEMFQKAVRDLGLTLEEAHKLRKAEMTFDEWIAAITVAAREKRRC